jgi:hypothetical protein
MINPAANPVGARVRPADLATSGRLVAMLGLWVACVAFAFMPTARAASSSADSNITTVDTTSSLRSIAGRVVDGQTRKPLAGATVRYAGATRTTDASGKFLFGDGAWPAGGTLAAEKAGYGTYQGHVFAATGVRDLTVADIVLLPAGSKPAVVGVESQYEGLFLGGISLENAYVARVNWNGRTPGLVEFRANGVLVETVPASGSEAEAVIDVGAHFIGAFRRGVNVLRVEAVDASGVRSDPFTLEVGVIPVPPWVLARAPGAAISDLTITIEHDLADPGYSIDIKYPDRDIPSSAVKTIPLLGKFGADLAAGGGVEYSIRTGDWQVYAGLKPYGRWAGRRGVRPHASPKFYLGNAEVELGIYALAEGRATQTDGIDLERLGLRFTADLKAEILTIYLGEVLTGTAGWGRALDWFENVGVDVNSLQRVRLYGLIELDTKATILVDRLPIGFDRFTATLKPGLEIAYEPDLKIAKGRVYGTGTVEGTLDWQNGQALELEGLQATLYAGIEFSVFSHEILNEKFVLLRYPDARSPAAVAGPAGPAGWVVIPVSSSGLKPRDRGYLAGGPARFVAEANEAKTGEDAALRRRRLLAFGGLGIRDGGGESPSRTVGVQGIEAATVPPASADLPLVENAYPDSSPALAGSGRDLMLLAVADDGSRNPVQFTDIRWSRFDGSTWTTPVSVAAEARGEFGPQVRFDGSGRAVATWERIKDPMFQQTDLEAFAARLEIVWAAWDRATGQWTVPQALTDNGHLDHAPQLCGPLSGGDVLLTWTENAANQLLGSGIPGGAANSRVLSRRWESRTRRWTEPQTVVDRLPFRLSESLAGATNRAVYAWTRDLDGVVTNGTDQQVFYAEWLNGAWGSTRQLTSDTAGNRNIRAAVSPSGDRFLVWQRGDDLVMSRNFQMPPTVVRTNSASTGFAGYALTVGPKGNLVLIWQETSPEGSDAWFSVYDPTSSTWSRDARLFKDEALERSFAPVWDDVGNLTLAYNKVQTLRTNLTVNLEGGGSLTFTNVPQSGRVDLGVLKRRLVRDLAVRPGDLTADASNFMPNAVVTLKTMLRNEGDLAIRDPVVALYDGDPKVGGTPITNIVVSGWFDGAATHEVTALWVLPEQGTPHTVFAVADPDHKAEDAGFTGNNVQSLRLGGTDLHVGVRSQSVETNGALRVVSEVRNVGAPKAGASRVALRRQGANGSALVSADVGELEPGRAAQVALDLPAGSVPEGETLFTLTADDGGIVGDVDRSNNTSNFAVSLIIDSDGDGIPDAWERQWGSNPLASEDAVADPDGDGLSNLGEYRAGTSPTDPASYLRLTGVAAGTSAGVEVRWGSVPSRLYTLLRSDRVTGGWVPVVEHVQSTAPENRFVDGSVTHSATFFYRVQVE